MKFYYDKLFCKECYKVMKLWVEFFLSSMEFYLIIEWMFIGNDLRIFFICKEFKYVLFY